MTNKEIQEKYGIEPIMKEMWVWNSNKESAELMFVSTKDSDGNYRYCCFDSNKSFCARRNASETKPNKKEPKVGDKGYFWDDENYYSYDELKSINTNGITLYETSLEIIYEHFSHEKKHWMK